VIQGKSDKLVYLLIQDGTVEIRDASALRGKGCIETREILKGELGRDVRVAAIGPAGENMVSLSTFLADEESSVSHGFGAVAGSKNLKAIAVRGKTRPEAANPEKLKELTKYVRKLTQESTRLPPFIFPDWSKNRQVCYGCAGGCIRSVFEYQGKKKKNMCAALHAYQFPSAKYYKDQESEYIGGYYLGVPYTRAAYIANLLCDEYGLDAIAIFPMVQWIERCKAAGILTDENMGMPLSKFGSVEFIEVMLRSIAFRDGFGDTLAQGIYRAADIVGGGARELIGDTVCDREGVFTQYDGRLYIATGLIYAMESRQHNPQLHDISLLVTQWIMWHKKMDKGFVSTDVLRAIAKRFWGSEVAADFSTYGGKALAAKMIQDRGYAKESLILCDFKWPIQWNHYSDDHVGDPTLESKLLSAITGREVDEEGLYRIGERIFNLQRAILAREGHKGRESDVLPEAFYTIPFGQGEVMASMDLVPGRGGEVLSARGSVVDREKFENMKDEYYQLRGWDVATGLQTKAKLRELGLEDIIEELGRRKLIV
jgi:aldehyde:ferredoxin oxidoreductase